MDLRHGAISYCRAGNSLDEFHGFSELVRSTKAERYLQELGVVSANGNISFYLRNGWILKGLRKEISEEIVVCSPDAIRMMFERIGNDAADSFKFSKKHEKNISNYKV